MTKEQINIKWILLGLIILITLLAFNYITFLEKENQVILANLNNSISQLQMRISTLEAEKEDKVSSQKGKWVKGKKNTAKRAVSQKGKCAESNESITVSGGNRGFLIKDRRPASSDSSR